MATAPDSKKRKKSGHMSTLSNLKKLGHDLLSSRAHVNNLPLLLNYISPSSSPSHALEALLSLQSFFSPLIPDLPNSSTNDKNAKSIDNTDPELIFRTWVKAKFDEFLSSLINVCVSSESDDSIRDIVLDTIMEFVKLGSDGRFNSSLYHKLLRNVVHSELQIEVLLESLASKFFKYIDVSYFTYISLEKIVRTLEADMNNDGINSDTHDQDEKYTRSSRELSVLKIHHILLQIPPLEGSYEKSDYDMLSGSGLSEEKFNVHAKAKHKIQNREKKNNVLSAEKIVKKMKLKCTKAWISFFRLPLPLNVYKEVLVTLHQSVIPYLSNPIMLCDFLTRSYDIGGVISVMALSSLFILMTQHGLEYPNFYDKLYALLVPSIFMAKHRAKFFELLDSCLKSPLLPAYLAAAFAKKLSRLALAVPPSGALVITSLIHNLLRRHPSINCLVHREDIDETVVKASDAGAIKLPGIDHFKNEEADPMKTNAMRSSLWEIDTLRHHYCPPVSRFYLFFTAQFNQPGPELSGFVLSLENDLTVRAKTTEVTVKDFSSSSYATVFGDEMRRRVKEVPLAFYKAPPTSLFSESDFPGWTFNGGNNSTGAADDRKQWF